MYDNELKISLWKAKVTSEKAPILRGTVTVQGVEYEVALWKPQSNNPNAPVLSGRLQVPQGKPDADDVIPF